jgi:type II secretory pathway predicted ATPase ExeA
MYQAHFGLKRPLFDSGIAQDSAVFLAARHQEIAASSKLALTTFDSAVVLTGPAGVGKTTLISTVLRTTSTKLALGWITVAPANAAELIELLLVEFGFNAHRVGRIERMQMWRQFLNEMSTTSSRVYVIAERAEDLGVDVLRALDSLTAAGPHGSLGANLVLLGQPTLLDMLKAPGLDALRQRVRLRQRLEPLTADELRAYLDQHAKLAGVELDKMFADGAMAALHEISAGIPRLANSVAETALTLAATRKEACVTAQRLREVARMFGIETVQPYASSAASVAPQPAAAPAPPLAAQPTQISVATAAAGVNGAPLVAHGTPAAAAAAPLVAAATTPLVAAPAVSAPGPAAASAAPVSAALAAHSAPSRPAAAVAVEPRAPIEREPPLTPVPAPAVAPPAAGPQPIALARPLPTPQPAAVPRTTSVPPAAEPPGAARAVPASVEAGQPRVAVAARAASVLPPPPAAPPPNAQPRAVGRAAQLMSDGEIDQFAATLTDQPDVQMIDFPILTDAVEPQRQRVRAETAYVKPPAPRISAPETPRATPPLPRVFAAASGPAPTRAANPSQPAAKPAPAPPPPVAEDADVLRQTQTMRAISVAKSIDDISNSMAETLFGDADLEMLSDALGAAGWGEDEPPAQPSAALSRAAATAPSVPPAAAASPAPKVPPAPAASPVPKVPLAPTASSAPSAPPVSTNAPRAAAPKGPAPADDDPFDFLGLGEDAPLELIEDDDPVREARKEGTRNR